TRIVRGRVLAVEDEHGVTFGVDETLAGEHSAELRLHWRGSELAPGWEGVLFLVPVGDAWTLRTPDSPAQSAYRLPLDERAGRLAFHSDMRRVENDDALLRAIRDRVARGDCGG